ncbi:Alpha/Beta hydrolase protein [Entophlyctis helioformis]|nr:Alpha/Beta hydrolase protein [Entophlyctis helioformis]
MAAACTPVAASPVPAESGLSATQTFADPAKVAEFAKYSRYAAASYCDPIIKQSQWTCGAACGGATAGTRVTKTFASADAKFKATGVVTVNDRTKQIVVIFRGSSTADDWISNFNLALDFPDWFENRSMGDGSSLAIPRSVKFHKGFSVDYERTRSAIQPAIAKAAAENPTYRIAIVGHSSGGALATLAAVDLANLFGTKLASRTTVYTYGQPRTGNKDFANWYSTIPFAGTYRLTQQQDPVVHLPPSWIGSYRHIKQEFHINLRGQAVTCTNESGNAGESTDCSNINKFDVDLDKHRQYFGWKSDTICNL